MEGNAGPKHGKENPMKAVYKGIEKQLPPDAYVGNLQKLFPLAWHKHARRSGFRGGPAYPGYAGGGQMLRIGESYNDVEITAG